MRVTVATPWFPSRKSPNSGIFNLRDVRMLAEDHEVTVIHLIHPRLIAEEEETFADEGFGIERVPFALERPSTIPASVRRLRHALRGAELVHSMAFSALLPVRLARPRGPWVHTEHYSQLVTPPASPRMAFSLAMLKRLFARPTETIAVSRSLAAVIDAFRRTPSTVIGNEVMTPHGPIPARPPEACGPGLTRVRMIGVGGLIGRKGPDIAAATMAGLREQGIDATLTWVGEGELRGRLEEIAAQAGIGDRLRLLGHLDPEDLSRELLGADLFLLPVETETFGVAIAEALAHGLPVVTTGTGGHTEFLPGEGARLVSTREPGALAEAVVEVLSDPNTPSREALARYAAERFSPDARRRAYREVYRSAVERSERSTSGPQ